MYIYIYIYVAVVANCINNHGVFVRLATYVHICLHLCRLINLQLAKSLQ